MWQVLVWVPFSFFGLLPGGFPIYGFGTMLFVTFVTCIWLAGRRAKIEDISKDHIYDLALWIFIGGIAGARIVFMIQYGVPWQNFFKIWEGGIVFYGSAIGGWLGYGLAWLIWFRKHHISTWKLADVVAPVVCIGLLLGRIGCFLNGCCYGHVCPEGNFRFPMMTAPAKELVVSQGMQTLAGFALDDAVREMGPNAPAVVGPVEPASAAARAGVKRGDIIKKVNDQAIDSARTLARLLQDDWPRGETRLALTVSRAGAETTLPAFTPRTFPLYPTQLYESISMFLLFLVLMAFFPFRRHYGQVFVVLMLGYAVHRFFNETLRNDTAPVLLNLTLSQVTSIGVFAGGIALEVLLRFVSTRVEQPTPTQQAADRHA